MWMYTVLIIKGKMTSEENRKKAWFLWVHWVAKTLKWRKKYVYLSLNEY